MCCYNDCHTYCANNDISLWRVQLQKKSIRNERYTHGWHIQAINEAILLLNAHVNGELILDEDAAGFASFTTDERFISNSVYVNISKARQRVFTN